MEEAVTETIQFTLETITELVNDSYGQTFPPKSKRRIYFPTLTQNIPVSILTFIIGVIGVLGNLMVVFVIYRKTNLAKQTTTKYIINQCALDAFSSVTLILSEIVALSQLGYVSPTMAKFYCNLWLFKHPFIYGIIMSSTYNLVMISVERYIAICYPLFYRTKFTYRFAHISIAIIWLLGIIYIIALGVPPVHLNENGKCFYMRPSQAKSDMNGKIALIIKIIIPISFHAYCYIFISVKLAGGAKIGSSTPQGESSTCVDEADDGFESIEISKTSVSATANKPNQAQTLKQKARLNVIKTLAIVTVVYMICWLPQNLYVTFFRFGFIKSFRGYTYKVFVIMMFANCSVNPFIYVANYEVFRKAFKSLIGIGK